MAASRFKIAINLRAEWEAALAQHKREDTRESGDAEQAAYDRLIEHVEATGLSYTTYDPR